MVPHNRQTLEGNESGERRGNRIPIMQSGQRHNDPKHALLRYLLFVTLIMVSLAANSKFEFFLLLCCGLRNVTKGVLTKDYELYFERFFRKVVNN